MKNTDESPAGKLELIMALLSDEETDDEGNVVGKKEPMISVEEARKLLGFPTDEKP